MFMIPRKRSDSDLFDDFFGGDDFFPRRDFSIMKTDIKEKGDLYIIQIDLPGYEKENINIELKDGYLEVSAKVEKVSNDSENEKFIHKERFYGHCSRNFYVGDQVSENDIRAEFKNGILEISVPKFDDKKKLPESKHIEIK